MCFSSHQPSRRRREGRCVSVYTINLRAEGAKTACLHTTILPVLCSRYIVYMYYMYYIYYMYYLKSIFVFYIAVLFVLIVFLFMMLALLRCYTSIFDGFIYWNLVQQWHSSDGCVQTPLLKRIKPSKMETVASQ